MAAFNTLNADRQISMDGAGPIPFTAIDRFAQRYGINDIDEFERFIVLIRIMDAEFCKPTATQPDGKTE